MIYMIKKLTITLFALALFRVVWEDISAAQADKPVKVGMNEVPDKILYECATGWQEGEVAQW